MFRSVHWWLNHFAAISASLRDYIISLVFLHVAKETSRASTNDELVDVLAETVGLFTGLLVDYSHVIPISAAVRWR